MTTNLQASTKSIFAAPSVFDYTLSDDHITPLNFANYADNIDDALVYSEALPAKNSIWQSLARFPKKALDFVIKTYPTKISYGINLPCSLALSTIGVQSGDPALVISGAVMSAIDVLMVAHGDRTAKKDEAEPQDTAFNPRNLINFAQYPHESAVFVGGMSAYVAQIVGGLNKQGSLQGGIGVNGVMNIISLSILSFVREQEAAPESYKHKWLNIPGIKNVADFVVTRPIMASTAFGLAGVFSIANEQLQAVQYKIQDMPLPYQIMMIGGIVNWSIYAFASKRLKAFNDSAKTDGIFVQLEDAPIEDMDFGRDIPEAFFFRNNATTDQHLGLPEPA